MPQHNDDPLEITDSGAFARLAFTGALPIPQAGDEPMQSGASRSGRTQAAGPESRRRRRQDWIAGLTKPVALTLLLLGPLLGVGAYASASAAQENRMRARLEELLTERAGEIKRRVHSLREVLYACQGFFGSSIEVERVEFSRFTRPARERHPCIRKIAWVEYVPASQLSRHEQRVRRGDWPGYRVRRDHGQPMPKAYYPILYVDPLEANRGLVGLDAMSDPRRAWAVEWAASSRAAVLSDPIEQPGAIERAGERDGYEAVLVLGVYPRAVGDAADGNRALGVLMLTFDYAELVRQSTEESHAAGSLMRLQVEDRLTPVGATVVVEAGGSGDRSAEDGLSATHQLSIAGQAWQLRAWPTALFRHDNHGPSPWLVALLVFFVWELFAGFLLALGHAFRGHALRSQGQMVGRVLQSLGEGVIVATCDGRVRLANREARKLLGRQALNLGAEELPAYLRFEDKDGRPHRGVGLQPLARALRGETIDAEECRVRTPEVPDGLWVSVSARPIYNNLGELRGGLLILRDVSAKRSSEELLREQKGEMELAARVQQSLYPRCPPKVKGLDLAGVVYPAHETCGDYYDYIPLPDGSLCLAIGDVSGHGLGPALVMAETRAYIRSLVASGVSLETVLSRANAMLAHDLQDEGLFVTMLLIRIDPVTRTIRYASAGHTPGLLVDAEGCLKAELGRTGKPLGMFDDSTYESRNGSVLEEDDVLVLMTDGATEASSPEQEMFDEAGVLEAVRMNLDASAAELVARIYDAVVDFSVGTSKRDDVTLLVCKVEGEPAEARLPMLEIASGELRITHY